MKALLIAEKPSLMRTIKGCYDKHRAEFSDDITFVSQAGHLYGLAMPDRTDPVTGKRKSWSWDDLPIDPDKEGGWKYEPIKSSRDLLSNIKKELGKKYDYVINAGDPDQEGELLIRETLSELHNTLPVKRFWSNDLTEPKVLYGLKHLLDDDNDPLCVNMLNAAKARQHSDYRVGLTLTEAATLKMGGLAVIGRVKTPLLSIICKREDEIRNFKPETVYGVKALYEEGFTGQLFTPSEEKSSQDKEENPDAGLVYFKTKKEAENLIASLGNSGKIVKYESKRSETSAPKLFKLSSAQVAAGRMGYTSARTLEIIQSLYEMKVISYPRTDCEYLASGENFKAMLNSATSDPTLAPFVSKIDSSAIADFRNKKKYVNDKALTESGHSALAPTTVKPDFGKLSKEQRNIYHLIARQFVAAFLPPLVFMKTELVTDIDGKLFKSSGRKLVDRGYTEIFESNTGDNLIPVHKVGDILPVKNFDIAEKTSTCPKRFKDPDLIAVCENPAKYLNDESLKKLGKKLSLGTPATRAGIIDELLSRNKYIKKEKGVLVPTETGEAIYRAVKDFPFSRVDMTAEWEEKLAMIREGSYTIAEMEEGIKKFIAEQTIALRNADTGHIAGKKEKEPIGTCPVCGGDLLEGTKGYYCINWNKPEFAKKPGDKGCKFGIFKKICDSTLTVTEVKKLLNGDTIKKKLKKGSSQWEQELVLLPDGKVSFAGEKKPQRAAIGTCPKCGKPLYEGTKGFYCEDFKGCGFGGFKDIGGHIVSAEEYSALAKGKTVDGLVMDMDTGKVSASSTYPCPKCGKPLRRDRLTLSCACGLKIWTTQCGYSLTEDDIKSLIYEGGCGPFNLRSKAGKKFTARIIMNENMNGTEFSFYD